MCGSEYGARIRFGFGAFLIGCTLSANLALAADSQPAAKAPPTALVELYTSEGCSSCPPADGILSEFVARARRDGTRIFALSFHVDYWDRLGWKDPRGNPEFSERQARYSKGLQPRYTPQMVVNGKDAFVGSDREQAERSVEKALAAPASVALEVQPIALAASGSMRVAFVVTPVVKRAQVHVAVVERGLHSQPARGENRDRKLAHDNVVRAFGSTKFDTSGHGQVDLAVPADVQRENSSIIAWVQDSEDSTVLGAAGREWPIPTGVDARRSPAHP